MTRRSIFVGVARRFWPAVGIVAVIALLVAVRASRTTDHSIRASFDAAVGLRSGMDVQLDGLDVGKVREVSYDHGRADVVLGIDDGPAWPLPRGTRAVLRHGTTIGSATRRVDLVLGPKGATPIPDGGVMPSSSTQTPVEWDEVLGTFDRATRATAKQAAARGAAVLVGRAPALAAGLDALPGGTDALAGILEDLQADRAMLDRLFPLTARVTGTLARHDDAIRAVVLVGRRTLQAFADRSAAVRRTLSALPPALAQVTTSLHRLDRTASALRPALDALAPGARSLRTLDRTLTPAIGSLHAVTAPALGLVAEVDRAASPLRRLLAELGPLVHDDGIPALRTAAPMLACFTPYAPELAGFLSNQSSWNGRSNGRANYGRYHVIGGSPTLTHPAGGGSLTAAAALPGVRYARALRPGELAGKPRDIGQCGYTPALRNPAKDPQARR